MARHSDVQKEKATGFYPGTKTSELDLMVIDLCSTLSCDSIRSKSLASIVADHQKAVRTTDID